MMDFQHAPIEIVQPQRIDIQQRQRLRGQRPVDRAIAAHLSVVAHTPQQAQRHARRAASAPRDLGQAAGIDRDVEQIRRALNDLLQHGLFVIVQADTPIRSARAAAN